MAPARPPRHANRCQGRVATLLVGAAVVLGSAVAPASAASAAGSKPAVCKDAAAFHSALAAIKDLSATQIPAAAKALHPAMLRFRSGVKKAPAAVRADWSAMAGALERIDAALQKTVTTKGLVKGRELDALHRLMQTLDADPTLNRAAQSIDRWLDQACGLTPHYLTTTTVAAASASTGSTARR